MMNALLAYNVFYSKGVTDDRDEENIAELIKRCYQKILSNFFYAHKCIKNNRNCRVWLKFISLFLVITKKYTLNIPFY